MFRELKVWASNALYASGIKVGTPTRIEPSAGILADGHLPDKPLGAQWENFFKYEVGRRAEALTHLAFKEWTARALNFSPEHFTVARLNRRGLTLYGRQATKDGWSYKFDLLDTSPPQAIVPSAGEFTPMCARAGEAMDTLVVGGSNDTTDSHLWALDGSTWTEIDLGSNGHDITHVTEDRATGLVYAITGAGETTKRIWQATAPDTWAEVGSFSGSNSNTFIAAHNNLLVAAEQFGSTPTEYRMFYSVNGGVTWSSGQTISSGAATSEIFGIEYMTEHGAFCLFYTGASGDVVAQASTDGVNWSEVYREAGLSTGGSGVVLPSGIAHLADDSTLSVRSIHYTSDFSTIKKVTVCATGGSPVSQLRFDGVALWAGLNTDWQRAALIG